MPRHAAICTLCFTQNDREPNTEYAEDIDGFLVDEVGDEEHEHSRWYDKHANPADLH